MEKLTLAELFNKCSEHNVKNNIVRQFEDPNPIIGVVVFRKDNFLTEYPLESLSYEFRSDNKYFISGMGGNSIFAESLDKSDRLRLDWYIHEWKIDYCYIKEKEVENNV